MSVFKHVYNLYMENNMRTFHINWSVCGSHHTVIVCVNSRDKQKAMDSEGGTSLSASYL